MKIGIVLSGGGIRGIAHLGVLQALKTTLGINFCKITGTSAGSIVGALFAEGHNPYEILQVFLKLRLFKYLRPAFGISGLLSMDRVANLLLQYIPHNSFEGLQTPLVITATNFSKGKLEYFSKGELILPILASSALPGIFAPVMIGTDMYVDGGVKNNFPVEALADGCDFIIGSCCNHLPPITRLNGIKHYMMRTATMIIESDMEEKRKLCDVVIAPEKIGEISVFDLGKAEEIYWIGYETTMQQLKTDGKNNGTNLNLSVNFEELGNLSVSVNGLDANNGTRTFPNGNGGKLNFEYLDSGIKPQFTDRKKDNYISLNIRAGGYRVTPQSDLYGIFSRIGGSRGRPLGQLPQGQIYSGSIGRDGKTDIEEVSDL